MIIMILLQILLHDFFRSARTHQISLLTPWENPRGLDVPLDP